MNPHAAPIRQHAGFDFGIPRHAGRAIRECQRKQDEAQAEATRRGEPWSVCELNNRIFCRPERRALSMKAKSPTARIIATFQPEVTL